MTSTTAHTKKPQENPLINLLFNIILPVVILNQLTKRLGHDGPTIALIAALAFPIAYGVYDYIKNKRKNLLSILGIINTLFTGGFALLSLEGFWFAVKEAAFPLLMGFGVLYTAFTERPLMKIMVFESGLMDQERIETALAEHNTHTQFQQHLKKSTLFLTASFFISSLLNFVLARLIFTDINPQLSELEGASKLNDQIAQMTWLGFVVIALPLMFFMMFILWDLIKGIRKLTQLELQQLLPHSEEEPPSP